jgi:hypothetical protein
MVRVAEHFFMYFLAIWTFSFEKALFISLPISSLGHWFFGSLDFELPVYSGYQSVTYVQQAKIFSHSVDSLFNLKWFLLSCISFLILCSPISQYLLLVTESLEFYWGNHFLCLLLPVYSLFFSVLTSWFQVLY